MKDKPAAISRREYLAGTGATLLAASHPAAASAPKTGPAGHRRTAPVFRRIDLGK
jgi:hypothetical protein